MDTCVFALLFIALGGPREQFLENLKLGKACDEQLAAPLLKKQKVDQPLVRAAFNSECDFGNIHRVLINDYGSQTAPVLRALLAQQLNQMIPQYKEYHLRRENEQEKTPAELQYIDIMHSSTYILGFYYGTLMEECKIMDKLMASHPNRAKVDGIARKSKVNLKGLMDMCRVRPAIGRTLEAWDDAGLHMLESDKENEGTENEEAIDQPSAETKG